MHSPLGIDHVEGLETLLAVKPGQQFRRPRVLKRERPEPSCPSQLQHARDDELAQPAVGVVEEPVALSRAAA
jgi:hypothetical protein